MTETKKTQEETGYQAKAETKAKAEKGRFKIPGMQAGRDVAEQLIRPWFQATSTTLEQIHDLNQRLFSKTQDAMKETFEFLNEGVSQCANVSQRTHQAMQDQLKRFHS